MKAIVWSLSAAVLTVLLTRSLEAQDLPGGKGKDLVASLCSGCHGLESVVSQKADKEGWETIVNYMVSRGLSASNDEVKTIVEYLAQAFPQTAKPAGKGK